MNPENQEGEKEIIEGEVEVEQGKEVVATEKAKIVETTTDSNFEGSIITKVATPEGRVVGYAIRRNSQGELEGNSISYLEDGSVGAVQQLYEADFDELRENGVVEKFEEVMEQERGIDIQKGLRSVLDLFENANSFDPWQNMYPDAEMLEQVQHELDGLSEEEQAELASKFFDSTIGTNPARIKDSYKVYGVLKGTAFGKAFRDIEDARLKSAGGAGFDL